MNSDNLRITNSEPDLEYDVDTDPEAMSSSYYYEMCDSEYIFWQREQNEKYDDIQVKDNDESPQEIDLSDLFKYPCDNGNTPNVEPDYDVNTDPGAVSNGNYYELFDDIHLSQEKKNRHTSKDVVDLSGLFENQVDNSSGFDVLSSLISIIHSFNRKLYFVHDGQGYGHLGALNKEPIKEEDYLEITTSEKLDNLIYEYQPQFDLKEEINIQWLHLCINMLSDDVRKKFYQDVEIWMGAFSSHELIELIKKNLCNTVLVKELVTLLPTTIVFTNQPEIEKLVEFLEVELKNNYPGILDEYLYAHHNEFNKQKEQMVLLNAIKDYAPQKLFTLEFLKVVERYNNLSEEPIFTTISNVKHLHMQVDNVKLYQYLGLKGARQSEINIWAENLIPNLFRKDEMKEKWGLLYFQYKDVDNHQKNWTLTLKEDSRLNEELFIKSFNRLLAQIRAMNPPSVLNMELDINQWFNNYWLKMIIEKSLPENSGEMLEDVSQSLKKI
jgi:hypothetical protein